MKNKKILIMVLIAALLIFTSFGVNAQEFETTGFSEKYEEWLALPEKEREGTIAPLPFNVRIESNNGIFNIFKNLANSISIPSKYDLRDELAQKGIELEVKDQMNTGLCWGFSSLSTVESNLALNNGEVQNFSERHMEYNTSKSFYYGQENEWALNRYAGDGGYATTAFTYYSRGTGPIPEELMPFENNEFSIDINTMPKNSEIKQVENMVYLPSIYKYVDSDGTIKYIDANYQELSNYEVSQIRNQIKKFIMENGAIVTSILGPGYGYQDYNEQTYAANNYTEGWINHDVTIIGWDDNYSKENFLVQPKEDGAYIVLNSWGEQWGDNGIYYISYEDLMVESSLKGVSDVENITYDTIYQHDISEMWQNMLAKYGANVFTATKDEILNKVMVGTTIEGNCNIYISIEENEFDLNNRKKIASDVKLNSGYTTIELDKSIEINKGKKFAIIVETIGEETTGIGFEEPDGGFFGSGIINEEESYISGDGTNWYDVYEQRIYNERYCNLSIKAFTQAKEKYLEVSDIEGLAYSNIGGEYSFDLKTVASENGNVIDVKIKKEDEDLTDIFEISGNTVIGKGSKVKIKCPKDIQEGLYTIEIGLSDIEVVTKQVWVQKREDLVEYEFKDINFVRYLATKLNDKLVLEDEMKIYTTIHKVEMVSEFSDGANKGITNISGIENFVNVSWVSFNDNKIEDFSPLNKLERLNILELANTGLEQIDLNQLTNLGQVSYINLSYNQINDISFIKMLDEHELKSIYLNYSLYEEPTGFAEIFERNIFDRLGLAGCTWLTSEKINNMSNLTKLIHLDLSNCAIDKLDPLSGLNLEELIIENQYGLNTFETLEPICDMDNLRRLWIAGNGKITNLDGMEKLVNLVELSAFYCQIEDATALEKLENLQYIDLAYNLLIKEIDKDIVEVPNLIQQTYDLNSKIYSFDGIVLEGCYWIEEGKTIEIDKNFSNHTLTIMSGPAAGTVLQLYSYGEMPPKPEEPDEPIIPDDKLITITIPDSELYKVLKTRIWNIEDSNDELQTITTHESVIKGLKEIDLSSGHDIKTLNGISNFPNLERIKLKYCYELEDITDILNLENIKEIYVCQQNKIDFSPILESQLNNNLAIITENDYSIYSYPDIELQEYMYKILELGNGSFEANIYYDIEEYWPFDIKNEEDKQQAQVTIDHENKKIKLKYDNKLTDEHSNRFRKIEFIITEGPFVGTRYSQIYEIEDILVKQDPKRIMYLEGDDFEEEGLELLILNENGEYVEVDEFKVLDGENLSLEKNWVDIMINNNPEIIYEYWVWLHEEEYTIKIKVEDENLYNALKSKDTCSKPIEEEWETESQFYESIISWKDDQKILYLNEEILQHVEYIDLSNKNIADISGLEKIYNLQNIDLTGNTQLDIVDSLSQLERLNTVILNNTSVQDIGVLLEKENIQKIEISKKMEETVKLENNIIELPEYIHQLVNEEGTTVNAYIVSNYKEEENEGSVQIGERIDIKIVDGKAILEIENYESEEIVKIDLVINGGKADQSTFEAKYQLPKIEFQEIVVKQDAKRIMYLEGDDFEEAGLEFVIVNQDEEIIEVEEFKVLDGENLSSEKNWVDIMINNNPELIYRYVIDVYKEEWTMKIQVKDKNLYNALKSEETYSICLFEEYESEHQLYDALISYNDEEKIIYTQDEWLQYVEYIDLSNKDIKDIDGLEGIVYLKNINLSENTNLGSIDKLVELERLETITLNNTSVEDVSKLLEKESVKKIEISKKMEETVKLENNIIELPEYIYQLINEEETTVNAYIISNYKEEENTGNTQIGQKIDIKTKDGKAILEIENYESEEVIKISLNLNGGKADQSTFEAKYQLPKIEEEKLTVDFIELSEEEGIVFDIEAGIKVNAFKEKIQTNGEVKLYTKDNVLIETDENLRTGMKLVISLGEETLIYNLSVKGDCNGDGRVRVGDLTTIMVSVAENLASNKDTSKILNGEWKKAVDLNADGKLNVSDIIMLKILIAENK